MNKKTYIHLILSVGSTLWVLFLYSCTKQTTPQPLEVKTVYQVPSEQYYANLRAYKKSDHPIFFGWFGNTGGSGSDTITPSLRGGIHAIPDSVDIVSCWGGFPVPGSIQDSAMRFAQRVKGTRFVSVSFGSGVESMLKKNDSVLFYVNKDTMTAIDNVAKAINDTIEKYGLDGFDLDYETAFGDNTFFGRSGGNATNDRYTQRLFKALSQYLGPLSGTRKLLIVDGQSDVGIIQYLDYFMQQAYGAGAGNNLESRMTTYGGPQFPAAKFVPCENFESYWTTGGVSFADPIRGSVPSLLGFAYWNPEAGRKGGIGAYHAEYDYGNAIQPYYYVRQAIQIMNPAAR